MPFPESDRVVYKRNPLKEVVCQINYPADLRIDAEPPLRFQEAIRYEFPVFTEEQVANFQVNVGGLEKPNPNLALRGKKVYKFVSGDSLWTIIFSRDSLALATTSYVSWDDFFPRFEGPIGALADLYQPPFLTRLGLRYINIIDRSALGLSDVPWAELLAGHIAGELADPDIGRMVVGSASQITLKVDNEGTQIVLNHGLLQNASGDSESAYLIDSDFSTTKKTEVINVRARLKDFNNDSGKLFRWCISDRLHQHLDPEPSASVTST